MSIGSHRLARIGAAAVACAVAASPAIAAEAGDALTAAEALVDAGDAAAGWTAFDRAVELFWADAPLTLREAALVGPAGAAPEAYRSGDTLTATLAPVGYGWTPIGAEFRIRIVVDVELATRSGAVIATIADFAVLERIGPDRTREFAATLSVTLPDLRPDDYELRLTLRDAATGKSAGTALSFRVVP